MQSVREGVRATLEGMLACKSLSSVTLGSRFRFKILPHMKRPGFITTGVAEPWRGMELSSWLVASSHSGFVTLLGSLLSDP